MSDLDGKFHHVFYMKHPTAGLWNIRYRTFHKYVKMARMLSVGAKTGLRSPSRSTKAILEAIKKGDADEAERLAKSAHHACNGKIFISKLKINVSNCKNHISKVYIVAGGQRHGEN